MHQISLATNNGHPRELYIAKAAENCGFLLVVPIISRTPTKDISPFSTLRNCGNSSKLQSRMKFPTPFLIVPSGSFLLPMIRGSKSSLNIMPSCTRFSFMSSALRSSASMYILRNLYIWNIFPFFPTRVCLKKIGPGDWM